MDGCRVFLKDYYFTTTVIYFSSYFVLMSFAFFKEVGSESLRKSRDSWTESCFKTLFFTESNVIDHCADFDFSTERANLQLNRANFHYLIYDRPDASEINNESFSRRRENGLIPPKLPFTRKNESSLPEKMCLWEIRAFFHAIAKQVQKWPNNLRRQVARKGIIGYKWRIYRLAVSIEPIRLIWRRRPNRAWLAHPRSGFRELYFGSSFLAQITRRKNYTHAHSLGDNRHRAHSLAAGKELTNRACSLPEISRAEKEI